MRLRTLSGWVSPKAADKSRSVTGVNSRANQARDQIRAALNHAKSVDEQQIVALAVGVNQQPAVSVAARGAGLDFQPYPLAFQEVGREPAGLSTVILHLLAAVGYLECVHGDQLHLVGLAACGPVK